MRNPRSPRIPNPMTPWVNYHFARLRFLGAHAAVSNLFNLGRHLVTAQHYRDLRIGAFAEWSRAVA